MGRVGAQRIVRGRIVGSGQSAKLGGDGIDVSQILKRRIDSWSIANLNHSRVAQTDVSRVHSSVIVGDGHSVLPIFKANRVVTHIHCKQSRPAAVSPMYSAL